MKNLYDYIMEAAKNFDSSTAFNHQCDDFDELLNNSKSLIINKLGITKEVKKLCDNITSRAGFEMDNKFIYALNKPYFKIPYAYKDTVIQVLNEPDWSNKFTYNVSGNKVKVSYNKKEIFETGSGSVGRVSTDQQESATCLVWNKYIETLENEDGWDVTNKENVKELVKDITEGFDSEWITSFTKQVLAISAYLNQKGQKSEMYKACRYGFDVVGKAYRDYIQKYTNILGGQKDNFDPADIILYKTTNEGEIISILRSLRNMVSDENTAAESKNEYIEQLFKPGLLVGISLKKISANNPTGNYEVFNIGEQSSICKVNKYDIVKNTKGSQLQVICNGSFDFNHTTTETGGEKINIDPVGKESKVILTMRSFGDNRTGMDVTVSVGRKKAPALGKCPVREWKKMFDLDVRDTKASLQECLKAMEAWLNSNNKQTTITGLDILIKAAIKAGPNCFPFVLIH